MGCGVIAARTGLQAATLAAPPARATVGLECRKNADVLDETPMPYKPVEAVMAAQADLVEVVHMLMQVVCAKG